MSLKNTGFVRKTAQFAKIGGQKAENFGLMWGMLLAGLAVLVMFIAWGTPTEKTFVGVPLALIIGGTVLRRIYTKVFPPKPSSNADYTNGWRE